MKRLSVLAITLFAFGLASVASWQPTSTTSSVARIKPLHAFGGIQPRLSPDGTTIVFSLHRAIWTLPRTGGVMTRLTEGAGFDTEPVWSPDGKRVALVRSFAGPEGELRLVNVDSGKDLPLPSAVQVRGTIVYPKLEFHPDGRRILGVFRAQGKDHGLAWYDTVSGAVTHVLTPPTWGRYALSHDGKWIAYTATMDVPGQQTGNDGPQADVWKVPAEGGKAEKITRFPARVHELCWTANGQGLIVAADVGGPHYDLWHVPLDRPEAGQKKWTFGQADEDRPSVSRDGRWLAYTDNRHGATSLMVRDLNSGAEAPVVVDRVDLRAPHGTLRLTTRDEATKKPVSARVSLQRDGGKFVAPVGSLYRILGGTGHYYSGDEAAEAAMPLPAGKYRLRVWRGPEYRVHHQEIDLQPGQNLEVSVDLTRWTNQAKAGWFSGENHIHANYGYGQWFNSPTTMLAQCAGEDLNVANFMVANSDTDAVFDRPFFRGAVDPLSTSETILYWNQEFRSTLWGHMTLVNLKQVVEPVFTGFKDTTNPWDVPTNADVAERTRWQGGLVNYTHVAQNAEDPFQNPYAAKALPIDVALGKIDTLDINNSYAGTVPIWYRLLNCGFRLPASAGTDCFLNRVVSRLPGGDRVYVRLPGALKYSDWIDGLRAGRSFVTNGPMVEFAIGEQGPGDVVKRDGGKVRIKGRATSAFPLDRVEVIFNGKVLVNVPLADDKRSAVCEQEVQLDRGGWLALRATGPAHTDSPLPLQYGHTSPIYVEIGGKAVRSKADALFFLNWIEQLALAARTRDRVPNEQMRRHVLEQLEAARAVFVRLTNEGV